MLTIAGGIVLGFLGCVAVIFLYVAIALLFS